MKKMLVILVLSFALVMPVGGCATINKPWQENVPQLKTDIFLFSKLATRVALTEAEMSGEDVNTVKAYLVTVRDLLVVPGKPDFDGARALVSLKLPVKYHVYGMTILDVLERYINSLNLKVTEDQKLIASLIVSGIDGALEAVEEFSK